MSDLTDEFVALYQELAAEFGEGLTATFYETESDSVDPDANEAGAATFRSFDPARQSYDHMAAAGQGGVAREVTVPVPPPQPPEYYPRKPQEVVEGESVLFVGPILRDDGTRLLPTVGLRLQVMDRFWQVTKVRDFAAGDGIAVHALMLQGGGRPWA